MEVLRKYNQQDYVYFPLVTRDGVDLTTAASHASGDSKITKDGGAAANTTNAFAHIANGIYRLQLSATELSAGIIVLTVIDQTSPKVWEDQTVVIATYGNASAQHAFDLDTATQNVNVASMDANSVTASAIASNAIGDAELAADLDVYQAIINVFDDDAAGTPTDRYVVQFLKNGALVAAGSVTSPTIQVIKADGSGDLVASGALTQVASEDFFRRDVTGASRMVDGAAYMAKVTATIDGSSRTCPYKTIGRDS